MLEWALTSRRRLTEQERTDTSCETRRLTLRTTAAQLTPLISKGHRDVGQSLVSDFDTAVQLLTSGSPVHETQLDKAESTLKEVRKVVADRPLSEVETLEVVKAVGLAKGHWFKCPNGHIYAIGECGGATEEATCPECQATIGDTQHRLRSDNSLATEMDGASHAAWSDTANMLNYRFDRD
ncbi:hypothetical protein NP493_129g00009 [Ridgeia piscesae]|uniref:RZ-type domain-containing protein n=1 Tax=Ridgeia piscesae TaxID=27915 RepID=A0AAD9P5J5_RIDPI|nr:hypothetical protein NP493_129g00009 [Ridgeia piscesae]